MKVEYTHLNRDLLLSHEVIIPLYSMDKLKNAGYPSTTIPQCFLYKRDHRLVVTKNGIEFDMFVR